MDRTAWIVVALCVVGLVVWEFYLAKQMAPRPAPSDWRHPDKLRQRRRRRSSRLRHLRLPHRKLRRRALSQVPTFAEKVETLRNSDVELRLTNRGGGITEAVMLNHIAEDAKRVILNSPKHTPIGAMVDDPAKPAASGIYVVA